MVRVPDSGLHQEAVQLCLRQRVRAVHLDRVLRCHHEERPRHAVRAAVDRDLALLHHLEQRRLRARRGTVDLVGEDDVGEHGAWVEHELARVLMEDRDAGDVARQQIRCELDPLPRCPQCACEAARERRLPHARDVLQQQVTLGEQADEGQVDHLGLALDEAVDRGGDPPGGLLELGCALLREWRRARRDCLEICHALRHPATLSAGTGAAEIGVRSSTPTASRTASR